MPSQKIKGTACTIYSLPAVYTVVVVYVSYTLDYIGASCFHGYKHENAYILQAT